ncbi:MAG: hypothetical protein R3F53_09090 [Gammaproteobacteria bacterium]
MLNLHMAILFFIAVIFCSIGGCSYTTAIPITETNKEIDGFRVYGSKPILVISDTDTKVIYVPNYSKEYAIRIGTYIAKNDTTLDIGVGSILTKVTSSMDATTPLTNLLNFAGQAVTAGVKDNVIGSCLEKKQVLVQKVNWVFLTSVLIKKAI